MPHHRSGALHQSNKSFKSRHATKGAQRAANGGKVERGTVTSSAKRTGVKGGAASADHTNRVKTDRRNAAKLQREKSRAGRLQEHRFFAASTASGAASSAVPKLVAVVPLCPDVDAVKFVERMTEGCEAGSSNLIGRAVRHRSVVADHGHQAVLTFVAFPRPLKQGADAAMDGESSDNHEQHTTHFMDVLGGCQVADYVIVLTSAVEEVDALGAALLESIAAQGAPTMVTAIAVWLLRR